MRVNMEWNRETGREWFWSDQTSISHFRWSNRSEVPKRPVPREFNESAKLAFVTMSEDDSALEADKKKYPNCKYYSKYAEEVMIDHSFKRSVEMWMEKWIATCWKRFTACVRERDLYICFSLSTVGQSATTAYKDKRRCFWRFRRITLLSGKSLWIRRRRGRGWAVGKWNGNGNGPHVPVSDDGTYAVRQYDGTSHDGQLWVGDGRTICVSSGVLSTGVWESGGWLRASSAKRSKATSRTLLRRSSFVCLRLCCNV